MHQLKEADVGAARVGAGRGPEMTPGGEGNIQHQPGMLGAETGGVVSIGDD